MKFSPGRLVATRGALAHCEEKKIDLLELVARHLNGDYGDLYDEDKRANDRAIVQQTRIVSAYGELYVITEWDRSVTTVLLKSDY